MSSELHTIQFTEKELAPLRRCIDGHTVTPVKGFMSHCYKVACNTVVYSRDTGSSNIYLQISKRWNTVSKNVDTKAPIYSAIILKDNSVIGDQEAIDVIADTVGR